ncbi:PucR family transcriptional regulator ligand-binding domain-containing protein [Streptomyces sp. NBC_00555]|uniref:helix-turn-helix domain-containing protein n=1 Tax=Streptomyces sp. NBC_00555 TaxID=2903662 RepID=UPI00224CE39B|nr:helix-turn-helix domain-containing protein [Streptomyces sp. NBC_00555]MCX5012731.1 PucR family transcriptional regulator ligand-binding domain-containing protein [Streptomyces sp. NBC_00555]
MHVLDLLQSDSLGLTLLWGEDALLGQEVSGVTATDLEDPGRFLGPGELVLSGLVWWTDGDLAKADRFVAALAGAGATALLAGEETHGRVPDELVAACRAHRVPIVAVPARTSFRAVTEAVYLRHWGDLSRRPTRTFALPENVRGELSRLLEGGAGAAELLDRACAHLGRVSGYLLTASGRTVARTPSAPALPARQAVAAPGREGISLGIEADSSDSSPYDAWRLYLPDPDAAPPRVLHEIAEVFARYRDRQTRRAALERAAGQEVIALLEEAGSPSGDPGALEEALAAAGLPAGGPYRALAATSGDALAEALGHLEGVPYAVGRTAAVLYEDPDAGVEVVAGLRSVWPLLRACGGPGADLRLGAGARAEGAEGLRASLSQARFALTAADEEVPVRAVEQLDTLAELLAGVPPEVRGVFGARTLGALGDGMLRETLEVFLANNCSWARTAEALHLHVNTVHYRIERVQVLTGRDLSRLDHKLDLYAALRCL